MNLVSSLQIWHFQFHDCWKRSKFIPWILCMRQMSYTNSCSSQKHGGTLHGEGPKSIKFPLSVIYLNILLALFPAFSCPSSFYRLTAILSYHSSFSACHCAPVPFTPGFFDLPSALDRYWAYLCRMVECIPHSSQQVDTASALFLEWRSWWFCHSRSQVLCWPASRA